MQLPIAHTYDLDFYDSVRLFLKEDSQIFKTLSQNPKLHRYNEKVFIKGKFIRIKLNQGVAGSDLPEAEKYFFVESGDIIKLSNRNLLALDKIADLPEYVMEVDQSDIASIELHLDYMEK